MSTETRLACLASQLLGDLAAVDDVARDDRHAADQQRLQLIVDAFEQVTLITAQPKDDSDQET